MLVRCVSPYHDPILTSVLSAARVFKGYRCSKFTVTSTIWTDYLYDLRGWLGRPSSDINDRYQLHHLCAQHPPSVCYLSFEFACFGWDFTYQMVPRRPLGSTAHPPLRRLRGSLLSWLLRDVSLIHAIQMGLALCATGWWIYIDVPQTPIAVVVCVIIFNAAFGYRQVFPMRKSSAHSNKISP
jgi:hypothetical protein